MLLTCCLRHTEVLFKEANTNLNHDNFIDLRENLFIHATFFHLHCFEKGFPWKMCFSLTTMVEPMYTLVPRPLALVCARVERAYMPPKIIYPRDEAPGPSLFCTSVPAYHPICVGKQYRKRKFWYVQYVITLRPPT